MNLEVVEQEKVGEIERSVKLIEKKRGDFIQIDSSESYAQANEFLVRAKVELEKIENTRLFFTKPLNEQVKKINTLFNPQYERVEAVMNLVKSSMSGYLMVQEKKRIEEEAKLQEQFKKKQEKAIANGKLIDFDVAPVIPQLDTKVETKSGSTVARKVWKFKVVDIKKVPRKYLRVEVAHSEVAGAIIRGVREIKGLEIYEDFQVSAKI